MPNRVAHRTDLASNTRWKRIPTLYCPTCGYNLTGLPENRCPECGEPFDRLALLTGEVPVKPLTIGGAFARISLLPAAFWLTVLLGFISGSGLFLPLALLASGIQLVFGVFFARRLAERIAVGRAVRESRGVSLEKDSVFILGWTLGLHACQAFLGIGGVIGLFGIWMLTRY